MPPKRKRADPSPKEDASASSKSTSSKPSCMATILSELETLASDKTRCSNALQAFVDGKCTFGTDEAPSKNQPVDCYWIILATHTTFRLTQALNDANDKVSLVLALLSHALSTVLLNDRSKLERCANAAMASSQAARLARSVVGHAICAVTIGSTTALEYLTRTKTPQPRALWACLQSLEAVIHLSSASPPKPHAGDDTWSAAQQYLVMEDSVDEQELAAACLAVTKLLKLNQVEEPCVAALQTPTSTKKPSRRSARAKEDTPQIIKRFQTLLDTYEENAIVMEGRVSIRRWASMAFVWLCRGQESVLQVVIDLLSNTALWSHVLECDNQVYIPGNVAMVALACRSLDVLSESGNSCGVRAPTGGMGAYAAAMIPSPSNTKRRSSSPKKSGHIWTRPDIRHAATVVCYNLIQAHVECLQMNCSNENLVGDFDSRSVVTEGDQQTARYYPFVNKSLDTLCRAAASSVVSSASVDASDSIRRLLGITSAFALGSLDKIDVKLCTFGVSNLVDCLRNVLTDDESGHASLRSSTSDMDVDETPQQQYRRLAKEYRLDDPLPIPAIPIKPAAKGGSRKKKSSGDQASDSAVCSFGGVFVPPPRGSNQERISDEELLSLYLRAMQASSGTPAEALFSKLISIVKSCYDTPLDSAKDDDSPPSPFRSRTGSKKRPARKKAAGSKRKRRKVGKDKEEAIAEVIAESPPEPSQSLTNRKAITSIRAALATDAMNALRMCLVHPHGLSSSSSSGRLRSSLRQFLTTEQICNFVQLGYLLDEVLVKTRIVSESRKTNSASESGTAASSFFSSVGTGDFAHSEKCLWISHINLCETLGRGQTSYDPRRQSLTTEPILGDAARRLAVFRAIAAGGKGESEEEHGAERWPLCLPAVQHALVTSNLTSEPFQTNSGDAAPEQFIADSFLASISSALDDLASIAKLSLLFGEESAMPQENVPLSLRDARLFVLAVCRLPSEAQEACLEKLVDKLFSFFSSVEPNDPNMALITSNSMVSGFLARAITVCVTLVNTVSVAPSLREALFLQVGPTQYQLPSLASSSRKLVQDDSLHGDKSWYTRERCFMGLFSDWESPTIPEVQIPDSPSSIKLDVVNKLNAIFETSLELGFSSAKSDKCHLLFAAWNASGKASAWDQTKPDNRKVDGASIPSDQFPRLLMELRDDICCAHRDIHGSSSAIPDSLLSSTLQLQDKGAKASMVKVKEILKKMLAKAEFLVDALVDNYSSIDDKVPSSTPLSEFAVFEALSTCLAFVVAEHTKAGNDFFSRVTRSRTLRKRGSRRGLSSYDDDGIGENYSDFEDDFDDDARIDTIARLHDACVVFGASPTHPDWLDTRCRLREGITASDAVEVAQTALKCLHKVSAFAYDRYLQCCHQGLTVLAEKGPHREQRAALALQLCCAIRHENMETPTEHCDQAKNIAQVCKVDKRALHVLLGDPVCENSASAKGAWCPNSAQRILGRLQDRSITIDGWEPMRCEYRAGGEWELILSETLLGACLDIDTGEPCHSSQNGKNAKSGTKTSMAARTSRQHPQDDDFNDGMDLLVDAERWRRVYETSINDVMPAAALLRFGLGGGTGRKSHPLNTRDAEIAEGGEHHTIQLRFTEKLPAPTDASEEIRGLVFNTIALLSKVSLTCLCDSTMKRACYAAAANLTVDSESLTDLESMQSLRNIFTALFSVRDTLNDEKVGRKENAALRSIVESLVLTIETQGIISNPDDTLRYISSAEVSATSLHNPKSLCFVRLLGFLGFSAILTLESIAGSSHPSSILSSSDSQGSGKMFLSQRQWGDIQKGAIEEIVSLLCQEELDMNDDTRYRLSRVLAGVCELEYDCTLNSPSSSSQSSLLLDAIAAEFDSLDDDCLTTLVRDDICLLSLNKESSLPSRKVETSKMLCVAFAFLLGSNDGDHVLHKKILATLLESIDQWSDDSKPIWDEHILDLLLLLGTRFDALADIGSKLLCSKTLEGAPSVSGKRLVYLERLFRFVRDLSRALESQGKSSGPLPLPSNAGAAVGLDDGNTSNCETHPMPPAKADNSQSSKSNLCSYARQKSFHDQFWYNCYTCGLSNDRGCCSVCARVCHRGHDVAYSRYSSFFCDCGADNADVRGQDRVSCKCLTSVSSKIITSGSGEVDPCDFYKAAKPSCDLVDTNSKREPQSAVSHTNDSLETKWIAIAWESFKEQANSSILKLKREAQMSSWRASLFGLIRQQYDLWDGKITYDPASSETQPTNDRHPKDFAPRDFFNLLESLREAVRTRTGKVLNLMQHSGRGMTPVRAAKANSLKMNLSSDFPTDRLKKAMLAKNEIKRVALVADSRGRLIIAEPCTLLFCSASPAVNVRYVKNSCESPLERRAQLCVLGSSPLKFNIVGMRLCRENERHLVVWGTAEACFVVLSPSCDRIEKSVDLVFDLEPQECESDYLLKCEWLPGSQTLVAVACGPFVKIFAVERIENGSRLLPAVCYSLAHEAMLRDVALVPNSGNSVMPTSSEDWYDGKDISVNLFLLLDSGHLHVVELKIDSKGDLEEQGERYLDPSEAIALPTAGVRLYHGASPSAADSVSRSIGEGSTCGLSYLFQSGLLLYSCVSSCVMALILDSEGDVTGSFELLPQVISSEVLKTGANGYNIIGPYSHWTELGIVEKEGSRYFRVACVGKSSKTNQPKLICVEFNENVVKVKELSWVVGNSMGLGLSLSSSFEGLAAFSAPLIADSECNRLVSIHGNASWRERAFLVAVTSNGAMLFFGEEQDPPLSTVAQGEKLRSSPGRRRSMNDSVLGHVGSTVQASNVSVAREKTLAPSFPVTLFENLINASDFDELTYRDDGVGSDSHSIKTKLSPKNSVFYMAPAREGCTITISLRPPSSAELEASRSETRIEAGTHVADADSAEVAIVALRVLVGSTTAEFIPKRLFVEGRPVELKSGIKRWYDLPLSHEEVALGIRNGSVSLGIGPSFDVGNNPLVDAVEVFVIERENIDPWLPTRLCWSSLQTTVNEDRERISETTTGDDVSDVQGALLLSISATTQMCKVLGEGNEGSADSRQILQHLIQSMAISVEKKTQLWECIMGLLETVEDDAVARSNFLDENILYGLSRALSNARRRFDEVTSTVGTLHYGDCEPGQGERVTGKAPQSHSSSRALWSHAQGVARNCCAIGARIAKSHPGTYMRTIERMISESSSSSSISVDSWKMFEIGMNRHMDTHSLVTGLVNMTLTELAIACGSEDVDKKRFARFSVISNLLESADLRVVESSCAAISSYLLETNLSHKGDGTKEPHSPLPASVERNDQLGPIAYKCDSCSLFPITDARYTLLEGDHDIDLCKECFRLGSEFANSQDNGDTDVIIRGKSLRLGESARLSCEQINQMQPVPISRNIEEQVEQARREVDPMGAEKSEVTLQKALQLSIGDHGGMQSQGHEERASDSEQLVDQQSKQEEFTCKLFSDILNFLFSSEKMEAIRHPIPLFHLVLGIISNSGREDLELDRGKQFARNLSRRTSYLLKLCCGSDVNDEVVRRRKFLLVLCIRSLTCLLLQKQDALGSSSFSERSEDDSPACDVEKAVAVKSKEKTDPRFVCDVHGVPAVRRRCSHGVNKGRRFYVCGKERKSRCRYFKWVNADETASDDASVPSSLYRKEMESFLWNLFNERISVEAVPIHAQLCDMLETDFLNYEASCEAQMCRPSEVKSSSGEGPSISSCRLVSMYDRQAALVDLRDGVFCSKQKLGVWSGLSFVESGNAATGATEKVSILDLSIGMKSESSSIEASLELFSQIAENSARSGVENESVLNWFSVLCEIISSSSSSPFRALAKRTLKRLCGLRRDVYHSVRDHYVFGFQFDKLITFSQGSLEESVLRKEQARQCGTHWKAGDSSSWTNLRAGSLIGTQDLMSENCLALDCAKKISSVLDELSEVTRSRTDNWRQFCGLSSIPRTHRKKKPAGTSISPEGGQGIPKDLLEASNCPPIVSLLWVACSLSGDNQVKAFTLIDAALNPNEEQKTAQVVTIEGHDEAGVTGEFLSSDGGMDIATGKRAQKNPFSSVDKDLAPEDALLGSRRGMSIGDIHAFVMQFVLQGKKAELRKVASRVAQSLCCKLSNPDLSDLFLRLVGAPLGNIGVLGCDCIEFLEFLQGVVRHSQVSESFQHAARTVVDCFTRQMQSLRQDPEDSGGDGVTLEVVDDGKLTRKRFDLSCCVHCHRQTSASPSSSSPEDRSSLQEPRTSSRSARFAAPDDPSQRGTSSARSSTEQANQSPWLPDQVKPFIRGRLETSTEATVSTEFANHVQLKFRLAISDIYLTVNDPRARFVKTVAVYFTPRQVSDVGVLKSEEYSSVWQRCATLSLIRGASRASCSLSVPVVAANLKFEYLEFYDKPGASSRSSDGSLLLHCPRCTRIVNNAHGVCGNCGEVAFQCRKCRHINYDRLDAFFCVECGYCSCGGFGYELTAGIASNAVAIVDEDAFARAVKTLRVATKLHEDLLSSLRDKVSATKGRKRSRVGDFDDLDAFSAHGPSLKRAFLGQLPTSGSGKGDGRGGGRGGKNLGSSAVASIASSKRSDSSSRVTAANKARSLLRLARQLRSSDTGSSERARSGDFFVRQAFLNSGSRGLLVEDMEESGDMLGIINSTDGIDVLPMDSSDSLSRLVASIQSRSRDSSGRDGEDDEGAGDGGDGGGESSGGACAKADDSSPKALLKECDRLHQLMREAERECFELRRRIDAWKRLETDALADFGSALQSTMPFSPTHCSVCAGPVTLHLLLLVMEIFQIGMNELEEAVTRDFVRALFEEPANMSKDLFELKRLMISSLATKSQLGARLILNELKARLRATRDKASAEILGKLLEMEFSLVDEYVELAMETAADCA